MTTATAGKDTERTTSRGDAGALLFELEGVPSNGRHAAFEVLKKIIGSHGGVLTPAIFSRYAIQPRPDAYAADVIEKSGAMKLTPAALVESFNAGFIAYLLSDKTSMAAAFAKLLDEGQKQGLEAAAITTLPVETAQSLLAHLGLADKGVKLLSFSEAGNLFPRADMWLKAAKQLGRSVRACIVVADHSSAIKSALAAGMKSVAAPSSLTSHQDFCGADVLLDSWDELSAKEILSATAPAT